MVKGIARAALLTSVGLILCAHYTAEAAPRARPRTETKAWFSVRLGKLYAGRVDITSDSGASTANLENAFTGGLAIDFPTHRLFKFGVAVDLLRGRASGIHVYKRMLDISVYCKAGIWRPPGHGLRAVVGVGYGNISDSYGGRSIDMVTTKYGLELILGGSQRSAFVFDLLFIGTPRASATGDGKYRGSTPHFAQVRGGLMF